MRQEIREAIQSANSAPQPEPTPEEKHRLAEVLVGVRSEAARPLLVQLAKTGVPLREVSKMVRKAYMTAAVEVCDGNKSEAARQIGVHRNGFYR